MRYTGYHSVDVLNGEGTRCSLFVSGCVHACKGCFNAAGINPAAGELYTSSIEDRIIADLNDTRIKRRGLSLLGGDPLYPTNVPEILTLCQRVKAETTGDIWLWTGYNIDEVPGEIRDVVDVIIDGKFVQELYDPELLWRGSSNQTIYTL